MARFIDNKAVTEIQHLREQAKETTDDQQFSEVLRRNFGKGIGSFQPTEASVEELGRQIKQVG